MCIRDRLYFIGFAPPIWLRREWQEPAVRAFLGRGAQLLGEPDPLNTIRELEDRTAMALGAEASIGLWIEAEGVVRFHVRQAELHPSSQSPHTEYNLQRERGVFENAARHMLRFQGEVDRLNVNEKAARHEGAPLSDEEIRRIASYQQSFSEMTRGEQFVQDVLRGKAREHERWIVGLPAAVMALIGLGLLARPAWRRRIMSVGRRPKKRHV